MCDYCINALAKPSEATLDRENKINIYSVINIIYMVTFSSFRGGIYREGKSRESKWETAATRRVGM